MCASGHRKENWAEQAKHEGAETAATEDLTNGQLQEERFHTRFHSSVRKWSLDQGQGTPPGPWRNLVGPGRGGTFLVCKVLGVLGERANQT